MDWVVFGEALRIELSYRDKRLESRSQPSRMGVTASLSVAGRDSDNTKQRLTTFMRLQRRRLVHSITVVA